MTEPNTDADFFRRMDDGEEPTPEEMADLRATAKLLPAQAGFTAPQDSALGIFAQTGALRSDEEVCRWTYLHELSISSEHVPDPEIADARVARLRAYFEAHALDYIGLESHEPFHPF